MTLNCCTKFEIQDQIVLEQPIVQISGAEESAEAGKQCTGVAAARRPCFSMQKSLKKTLADKQSYSKEI